MDHDPDAARGEPDDRIMELLPTTSERKRQHRDCASTHLLLHATLLLPVSQAHPCAESTCRSHGSTVEIESFMC